MICRILPFLALAACLPKLPSDNGGDAGTDSPGGIDGDSDADTDLNPEDVDDDGDGYSEADGDCDDTSAAANPGGVEVCDGADNDCDGLVDQGTACFDDDGDGFTEDGGDCDDANAAISPSVSEVCDAIDNDCDHLIDEDTNCGDDDRDGFSEDDGDCNDGDPAVFPGAEDHWTDAVDQNCDGIDGPDCTTLNYHPAVDGLGQGDCYMGDGTANTCKWSFCDEGYNAVTGALYIDSSEKVNLNELWCLCAVGGRSGGPGVSITYNDSMTDITGLENIQSIGGNVSIACNRGLSDASASALIAAIGAANIGGTVTIGGNGSGYGSYGCGS